MRKDRLPRISFQAGSLLVILGLMSLTSPALAQNTGGVTGRVTRADDSTPIANVILTVAGTPISGRSEGDGSYLLSRIPAGEHVIQARWLGYSPQHATVLITAGEVLRFDFALEAQPIRMSAIIVEGASRAPERIVEAPAAISVVDPMVARDVAITGQAPLALARLPGVDVVQNSMNDFNVNARGFNSAFNRRVLLLQDGRDQGFSFLGMPLWAGMSGSLGGRFEMVRGPGSALYGANAYMGVVSLTTPPVRETVGTRISLAGGELNTLRADLSHAGMLGGGRFGYQVKATASSNDSWDQSRTSADGADLRREYATAAGAAVADFREVTPLPGQTLDPPTGGALGEADRQTAMLGSVRFDHYGATGDVITAEAAYEFYRNNVFMGGASRYVAPALRRPWARLGWNAERFSLMAWWSGESYPDDQPVIQLSNGSEIENRSGIAHIEGQLNQSILDGRGRVVLGASARNYFINTGTTVLGANDDRSDLLYSVYGQFEIRPAPRIRLVAATRFDDGDIIDAEFSPKVAIVFSPTEDQAVRLTFNRAFLTPSHTVLFLNLTAAPPANLSLLEAGLRASPLGAALAGVPNGELFTNSAAVPFLARGNGDLSVERVTSVELGYRGQLGPSAFMAIDTYFSRKTNFVSDLLPAVNPAYPVWTAPEAVPEALRGTVEQTVRDQLSAAGAPAAAFARQPDGGTAFVFSYTNVGTVDEFGVELELGIQVTSEFRLDGNYAVYTYDADPSAGGTVSANTPRHKGNLSATYAGRRGFDARVSARFVDSYHWLDGIWDGNLPASQTVELSAGYQVNSRMRVHAIATNVFDQQRFHIYGGSVIGRRVLAGVTAQF